MKKTITTTIFILLFAVGFAQIPSGYYDNATGTGDTLRLQLREIIDNHTVTSYDNLWNTYDETDLKSNGKIWDIYSNCSFTFSSDQCGSYSNICDCYNREHTVPKSWFGGASPMKSDMFHVLPTDGKINGIRANYPYGECASGTTYGISKLGNCTYPGHSGTVFEPADEYKGDIARIYFYMVTRYDVTGWHQDPEHYSNYVFSGDSFTSWTLNMLLEWNAEDPVSQKEIDRNEAVYDRQHNRNPYIDHPEWVCKVFTCPINIEEQQIKNISIYPNPFSDQLQISYELYDNTNTTINIIDLNGQIIHSFSQESMNAGTYDYTWNVDNNLQNGVYFAQIITDEQISTQKIILMK